ncbi:hypothetical protein HYR99_30190 [Candidatus Poribacteria bacterium]|nr:hypothetical protein [Candidatus Poribacteria bacterium]
MSGQQIQHVDAVGADFPEALASLSDEAGLGSHRLQIFHILRLTNST